MHASLLQLISHFFIPSEQDIILIHRLFNYSEVKKNSLLTHKNQVADQIYFVVKGFIRLYKLLDDGTEQTIYLIGPGEFAASFPSFITGTPSEEILHAITDIELLSISKGDLEELYDTDV